LTEKVSSKGNFNIKRWIIAALIMLSAGILFWELAIGIQLEEGFAWDVELMLALESLHRPWLDTVFKAITHTAGPLILIPIALTVITLWRRSEKLAAALVIASFLTSLLVGQLFKMKYDRPRPDVFTPLVVEHTASFPSGHTLAAVSFYGLLSVLLWERGHRLLSVISGSWVFLIALSRVYLGAHYPSDVLASLALGTILLFITLFTYKRLTTASSP
jgi:undecaprenyl-diphosphatase